MYKITESVVITDMSGVLIILDTNTGNYYALNEVAKKIWRMIEKSVSSDEIVNHIAEEYQAEQSVVLQDVNECFESWISFGFISKA
ncbi:PqqD family protein [Paenibacillus cymbidii]|uniref:PqqD family protein n=1 Tax=Paenibacillus cymbidii TaxID=1639034 RepID=UPI001081CAEB|nr:PqqD family protein [Paenibacillus cymbidii]